MSSDQEIGNTVEVQVARGGNSPEAVHLTEGSDLDGKLLEVLEGHFGGKLRASVKDVIECLARGTA